MILLEVKQVKNLILTVLLSKSKTLVCYAITFINKTFADCRICLYNVLYSNN